MIVFYIHFHADELAERMADIECSSWEIRGHSTVGERAAITHPLPDVLILSLDRLPSHAHAYADWMWQAKKRQSIPIVFVGGSAETIALAQRKHTPAHFCEQHNLKRTLENLK